MGGCPRHTDPPLPTTITLWHTFNREETATLNRILDRLRIAHPSWKIQSTVIPFTRAQNEFRRAAQECGQAAPDIFRTELPWLAEFVSNRLLVPVPPAMSDSTPLLPQARRAGDYLGRRWALSANLDCLALFYDKTVIDQPPHDLQELIAIAQQATQDLQGHHSSDPAFKSD